MKLLVSSCRVGCLSAVKRVLIFFLVLAVCLELGSYVFIWFVHSTQPRLVPFLPYPEYRFSFDRRKDVKDEKAYVNELNLYNFWYTSGYDFGNWHKPNTSAIHPLYTKSITYTSNSQGMRDREREKTASSARVFFLGDSFVEGVGVTEEDRFTNIMEKQLGCEVLNFGMGGNCGPVQEWLIYRHFANIFEHDAVFLGLFPANDFWDVEIEYDYNALLPSKRPFLVGRYPDYTLEYVGAGFVPPGRPSQEQANSSKNVIKRAISSFFATPKVLNYADSRSKCNS